MIRDRIKGLVRRRGVGPGFDASKDRAFARLGDAGEAAFQLVGAAVVGTWEVLLADVGRAWRGHPERDVLVERLSDGLVPTQQAFQSAGHRFRKAVQDGVRAGLAAGALDRATAPQTEVLRGLGPAVAKGWGETVEYLEPVFQQVPGARGAIEACGPEIERRLAAAADEHARAMAALPDTADLGAGLTGAIEAWQAAASRAVEEVLYDARTALVDGAGG